ncbi:hypothetical protein BDN72DRAFT_842442 [Pluteus cervinus]|uniref:Uncharacterized protein n=1 Tax=Pluteus cervinus TaxID=181527 RepID=A0ACD3ARL9_9AGAR|nr:hypothetical protein BDN72DRAFT_842442 [Pluteus cervinus]
MASIHPILTQHFDTNDIAFAKIDHELAILKESIRVLHAFRNTFSPVYRLPPEILTRIFSFMEDVPSIPAGHRASTRRRAQPFVPFGWQIAIRVSQRWRNVALESPSLWAHISSVYPKRITEELLKLSKAVPLTMQWHMVRGTQLVDAALVRARELVLTVDTCPWSTVWSTLSSPAPLLECLKISTDTRPSPVLSNCTFAGTTPRLRRLELTGCSVDVTSTLLTHLTTLYLCYPSPRMSITELLRVLRGLQGLASLSLYSVLRANADTFYTNSDKVTLPNLKSIVIDGHSLSQDLNLLSHLSIPKQSTLYFRSIPHTEAPLTGLTSFLNMYDGIRFPTSPFLNSTKLYWTSSRLVLSAEHTESPGAPDSFTEFALVRLERKGFFKLSDNPETANMLSSLASLTFFKTDCNIHVDTWFNFFGALPKLKLVFASGVYAVNLLSAIAMGVTSGTSNTRPGSFVLAFPQLETIELQDANLPESLKYLVNALHARKNVGRSIKALEMIKCTNMNEERCEDLRECVDNVVWDGWAVSLSGNVVTPGD